MPACHWQVCLKGNFGENPKLSHNCISELSVCKPLTKETDGDELEPEYYLFSTSIKACAVQVDRQNEYAFIIDKGWRVPLFSENLFSAKEGVFLLSFIGTAFSFAKITILFP